MSAEDFCGVSVAVRIRPRLPKLGEIHTECCFPVYDDTTLTMVHPGKTNPSFKQTTRFSFDHVFTEEDTQQVVYDTSTAGLVDTVLQGGFGTVIAYGQTGSGKTYTILGSTNRGFTKLSPFEGQQLTSAIQAARQNALEVPADLHDGVALTDVYRMLEKALKVGEFNKVASWYLYGMTRGLFPPPQRNLASRDPTDIQHLEYILQQRSRVDVDYSINDQSGIFLRLVADILAYRQSNRNNVRITMQLSIIEVYMDEVMDLLNNRQKLVVRDVGHRIDLEGLSSAPIESIQSLMHWFYIANSFRTSRPTMKSDMSSRSHAIFKIRVKQERVPEGALPLHDLSLGTDLDPLWGEETYCDVSDIAPSGVASPNMRVGGTANNSLNRRPVPKSSRSSKSAVLPHASTAAYQRSKTPVVPKSALMTSPSPQRVQRKAQSENRAPVGIIRKSSHSLLYDLPWENTLPNTDDVMYSCVTLVDLAGNERGMTETNASSQAESKHINGSLSALGRVICGLFTKSKHIPFRDKKLTQLLRSSFIGANSNVLLLATLSPVATNAPTSLSTLKFCDQVKSLIPGECFDDTDLGPQRAYLNAVRSWQALTAEMRLLKETINLTSSDMWSPRRTKLRQEAETTLCAHYYYCEIEKAGGGGSRTTPRASATPVLKGAKGGASPAVTQHSIAPAAAFDLAVDESIISKASPGNDILGLLAKSQEQQVRLNELHTQYREVLELVHAGEAQMTSMLGPTSGGATIQQLKVVQRIVSGESEAALEGLKMLNYAIARTGSMKVMDPPPPPPAQPPKPNESVVEELVFAAIAVGCLRSENMAKLILPDLEACDAQRKAPACYQIALSMASRVQDTDLYAGNAVTGALRPLVLHNLRTTGNVKATIQLLLGLPTTGAPEKELRVLYPLLHSCLQINTSLSSRVLPSLKSWWYAFDHRGRIPVVFSQSLLILAQAAGVPSWAYDDIVDGMVRGGQLVNPTHVRCLAKAREGKKFSTSQHSEFCLWLWAAQQGFNTCKKHPEALRALCEDVLPRIVPPLPQTEYEKQSVDLKGCKQYVSGIAADMVAILRHACNSGGAAHIAYVLPCLLQWCITYWPYFGLPTLYKRLTVIEKLQPNVSFGVIVAKVLSASAGNVEVHLAVLRLLPQLPHDLLLAEAIAEGVIQSLCASNVRQWLPLTAISTFLIQLGSWAKNTKPKIKGPGKKHLKQVCVLMDEKGKGADVAVQGFAQTF